MLTLALNGAAPPAEPDPDRHAMLVEETEEILVNGVVWDGSPIVLPSGVDIVDVVESRVIEMRIWLLAGTFNHDELVDWANAIRDGHATMIDAMIGVVSINVDQWPRLVEYFQPGMAMITSQAHDGIQLALNEVTREQPARAYVLMNNLRAQTGVQRWPVLD